MFEVWSSEETLLATFFEFCTTFIGQSQERNRKWEHLKTNKQTNTPSTSFCGSSEEIPGLFFFTSPPAVSDSYSPWTVCLSVQASGLQREMRAWEQRILGKFDPASLAIHTALPQTFFFFPRTGRSLSAASAAWQRETKEELMLPNLVKIKQSRTTFTTNKNNIHFFDVLPSETSSHHFAVQWRQKKTSKKTPHKHLMSPHLLWGWRLIQEEVRWPWDSGFTVSGPSSCSLSPVTWTGLNPVRGLITTQILLHLFQIRTQCVNVTVEKHLQTFWSSKKKKAHFLFI